MSHEHKTLLEELRDVYELPSDESLKGKPVSVKLLRYATEVVDVACVLLHRASGDGTIDVQELIDAAEQFYDEVVVPIDLPINDWLEPLIEAQVRNVIAPAIAAAHARLTGDEAA